MFTLVICLNIAIALVGFYAAWRIWRAKQRLISATAAIVTLEQEIEAKLSTQNVTDLVVQAHKATIYVEAQYSRLTRQLQLVRQVMIVVLIGWRLWQGNRGQWRRRLRIW